MKAIEYAQIINDTRFSHSNNKAKNNNNHHYQHPHQNSSTPSASTSSSSSSSGPAPMEIDSIIKFPKKLTPAEKEKLAKEGRCFRCQEKGHQIPDCPKKWPSKQQINTMTSSSLGKGQAQ
jgi:hypothetical protein